MSSELGLGAGWQAPCRVVYPLLVRGVHPTEEGPLPRQVGLGGPCPSPGSWWRINCAGIHLRYHIWNGFWRKWLVRSRQRQELLSQVALAIKTLPANADVRDMGFDPRVGKIPLEEGMATHSNILSWRISWIEESGVLQSTGSHRVGQNCSDSAHAHALWRLEGRWRAAERRTAFKSSRMGKMDAASASEHTSSHLRDGPQPLNWRQCPRLSLTFFPGASAEVWALWRGMAQKRQDFHTWFVLYSICELGCVYSERMI